MDDTPSPLGAKPLQNGGEVGAAARRERLKTVFADARSCTRCAQLVGARQQVVFGGGDADADLLFVVDASTAREDEHGEPLVGMPGRLFDELLASIGLLRSDVFVTHALKCHTPEGREPTRGELDRCRDYLDAQFALVQPRVVVALGEAALRRLRGDGPGISDVHGRPQPLDLGDGRAVHLLPLYHPAAALYTRALVDALRDDFGQIPDLLQQPAELPVVPEVVVPVAAVLLEPEPEVGPAAVPAPEPDDEVEPASTPEPPADDQLGLF